METRRFETAVVVGQFYPFHLGHQLLVRSALAGAERVDVMLCESPGETITGVRRADWVRRIFAMEVDAGRLVVHLVPNDLPSSPGPWAERTWKVLGGRHPHAVYSSEAYGERWAQMMSAEHVLVDGARREVPASGTLVRSAPVDNLGLLDPVVRADLVPRVVVLGAESTGTSTLSLALAEHYRTEWVGEYGREFTETTKTMGSEVWDEQDFIHIAHEQSRREDEAAGRAAPLLVCDTDAFATGLWFERYFPGRRSAEVDAYAAARRPPAGTILTSPVGVELEQDGWREGGAARLGMHERFRAELGAAGRSFLEVVGARDERLAQAIAYCDGLITAANRPWAARLPEPTLEEWQAARSVAA